MVSQLSLSYPVCEGKTTRRVAEVDTASYLETFRRLELAVEFSWSSGLLKPGESAQVA